MKIKCCKCGRTLNTGYIEYLGRVYGLDCKCWERFKAKLIELNLWGK